MILNKGISLSLLATSEICQWKGLGKDFDNLACWSSQFSTRLIPYQFSPYLNLAKSTPWNSQSLAKHRVDDIYCILHIHCICHFIIEGTDTGQAHCDTGKSVLTAASFCPLLIMKKTSRRICSIILLANEAVLTRLKISSSSFLSFRWA